MLDFKSFQKTLKEGWDMFVCHGSDDGIVQLQKVDEDDTFKNDKEALTFVIKKAQEGSQIHKDALSLLVEHNPQEFLMLIK